MTAKWALTFFVEPVSTEIFQSSGVIDGVVDSMHWHLSRATAIAVLMVLFPILQLPLTVLIVGGQEQFHFYPSSVFLSGGMDGRERNLIFKDVGKKQEEERER